MKRLSAISVLNKIQPSHRLVNSNESEEKPKQSYLEKPKKIKPITKNQTSFFYSNIL
jgi:hypothetical protein